MEENDKITIYADLGERSSGIPKMLKENGLKVILQKLPVADYILSERVAVERKTASDFAASIKTKRLFRQLQELKLNFERPLVIIEAGYMLYELAGIHQRGLKGALLSIILQHDIPIIYTMDSQDTAIYLEVIARQENLIKLPSQMISLRSKKLTESLSRQQRYIVEAIPNIGPKLSAELLKHFGSIRNLVLASEKELKEVPKIGTRKAKLIKELLTGRYIPDE